MTADFPTLLGVCSPVAMVEIGWVVPNTAKEWLFGTTKQRYPNVITVVSCDKPKRQLNNVDKNTMPGSNSSSNRPTMRTIQTTMKTWNLKMSGHHPVDERSRWEDVKRNDIGIAVEIVQSHSLHALADFRVA
jgi:hypothetical protein